MDADEGASAYGAGLSETVERAEQVIAEAKTFLTAYQAAIQAAPPQGTGNTNTATASVVTGNSWAIGIAVAAALVVANATWIAKRDRDAADAIRVAQVDAINSRWQADIEIRDARQLADAAARTAELRIMAAERRADMAKIEALQSQLRDHTDDLKGIRAWLKSNGEKLALLEARNNAN